ncbi:hypothetical protein D3C74_418000 [compost metagenome]
MGRIIEIPSRCASSATPARYGMSESLRRVNLRVTSTASSSNAHGTRTESEPCRRLWEDRSPKANHLLKTPASGTPSKPPMSWLQYPNPDIASESPPRSDSAIDAYVESQSPPQWTGSC